MSPKGYHFHRRPCGNGGPLVSTVVVMSVGVSTSSSRALAWMALSAVLFASMGFFARLASAHVSWTLVATSRAAIGAIIAVAVAKARGAKTTVDDRRGIWARSIFGT